MFSALSARCDNHVTSFCALKSGALPTTCDDSDANRVLRSDLRRAPKIGALPATCDDSDANRVFNANRIGCAPILGICHNDSGAARSTPRLESESTAMTRQRLPRPDYCECSALRPGVFGQKAACRAQFGTVTACLAYVASEINHLQMALCP